MNVLKLIFSREGRTFLRQLYEETTLETILLTGFLLSRFGLCWLVIRC